MTRRMQLGVFLDVATGDQNNPQVGESPDETLSSVGLAYRWNIRSDLSLEADFGYVLDGICLGKDVICELDPLVHHGGRGGLRVLAKGQGQGQGKEKPMKGHSGLKRVLKRTDRLWGEDFRGKKNFWADFSRPFNQSFNQSR